MIYQLVFAIMMVLWSLALFEGWKRKEIKLAVKWGQTNFEETEVERSAFRGVQRRSPIDDEKELFFSGFKKFFRVLFTITINLIMIAIVFGVIVGLIYLRKYLYELWEDKSFVLKYMATLIPSILNAF